MPRFLPVQCHKCSVLQIKPAQKSGLKWCCSMCRKPEIKVTTDTESPVTDVSLFVEELNLPQSAEEMESVSNTFHGVENLGGIGNWEGLYFQSAHTQFQQNNWKRVNPIKVYEDDFVNHTHVGDKRGGSQHRQFLGYLWGRWHNKSSNKDVVELMEFAGGDGNEDNVQCS
ncbi:uncharacterized protein [Physcomitrium patens]|uniref:Uncharacterized protein n=1 Tax=Physcomitrium patens TaxID=3218 RepID=A0A2K1JZ93_PHYPA|nr:uncharacterized protein LOC112287363 [Physcomitrium patens]PNR46852.1 hypothetical protein PHYPA_013972 [Physcomitrium patens]|eukprot:XP_024386064.1 uncharacterized protein LOC112287363 [Physcomitrella patens]